MKIIDKAFQLYEQILNLAYFSLQKIPVVVANLNVKTDYARLSNNSAKNRYKNIIACEYFLLYLFIINVE